MANNWRSSRRGTVQKIDFWKYYANLSQCAAQEEDSHDVHVLLDQLAHRFHAASCVNIFVDLNDWAQILHVITAHYVDETSLERVQNVIDKWLSFSWTYIGVAATREGDSTSLRARIGRIAMEVNIVGPILVPIVWHSTTFEFNLNNIDQVLQVRVIPIFGDQILAKSMFEEMGQSVGKHKGQCGEKYFKKE